MRLLLLLQTPLPQVCDRGLTLGHLIGTLEQFFKRLGLPKLRFKPAFNPYTEPSMEIFSYSEQLGKWIEVGNSGMFRPEMLQPMGLPEDVTVIAWGLSLERWALIPSPSPDLKLSECLFWSVCFGMFVLRDR